LQNLRGTYVRVRVNTLPRTCARVASDGFFPCIRVSWCSCVYLFPLEHHQVTVAHDEGMRMKHPLEFRYVRVDYGIRGVTKRLSFLFSSPRTHPTDSIVVTVFFMRERLWNTYRLSKHLPNQHFLFLSKYLKTTTFFKKLKLILKSNESENLRIEFIIY